MGKRRNHGKELEWNCGRESGIVGKSENVGEKGDLGKK